MKVNLLFPLLFSFILLFTCSHKNVNLSKEKTKIDTIQVMPPILNLHCVNAEAGEASYDTILMKRIDRNITNTYSSLLNTKYVIQSTEHKTLKPDFKTVSRLKHLIDTLTKSKKKFNMVQVDTNLFEHLAPEGKRYFLFTYMEGGYRSKKNVNTRQKIIAPLLVAGSLVTGSALYLLAGHYSNCRFYQYLYDRRENRIVLYAKSDKYEGNLWEMEAITQLTKTVSKKLYYN